MTPSGPVAVDASLVWLASYPKSGNTWFRAFLSSLRRGGVPVDLNALASDGIVSSRQVFERQVGVSAADLPPDAVHRLRLPAWQLHASASERRLYVKRHDAYDGTRNRSLYFVRNPLDVCISFAHHEGGASVDDIIERMSDPSFSLGDPSHLCGQLPQLVGSWSGHVHAWLTEPPEVRAIRYEDMAIRTLETFRDACDYLGLPTDRNLVLQALAHCSFPVLQQQERESGFSERPSKATSFFRCGRVGSWRGVLTDSQVRRLISDHGDVMRTLGYLSLDGPVF